MVRAEVLHHKYFLRSRKGFNLFYCDWWEAVGVSRSLLISGIDCSVHKRISRTGTASRSQSFFINHINHASHFGRCTSRDLRLSVKPTCHSYSKLA